MVGGAPTSDDPLSDPVPSTSDPVPGPYEMDSLDIKPEPRDPLALTSESESEMDTQDMGVKTEPEESWGLGGQGGLGANEDHQSNFQFKNEASEIKTEQGYCRTELEKISMYWAGLRSLLGKARNADPEVGDKIDDFDDLVQSIAGPPAGGFRNQ